MHSPKLLCGVTIDTKHPAREAREKLHYREIQIDILRQGHRVAKLPRANSGFNGRRLQIPSMGLNDMDVPDIYNCFIAGGLKYTLLASHLVAVYS